MSDHDNTGYGALPLCAHCNKQPQRIVRMYGSQLVWLCLTHYAEYRGVQLAADGWIKTK